MYCITKDFFFSAAHQLHGLPTHHPCSRLHGHNYVVRVELASDELDDTGFVIDYGNLASFKEYLHRILDHRNLNDVIEGQPSAENIARHLFRVAKSLCGDLVVAVHVSETPKTRASYRP